MIKLIFLILVLIKICLEKSYCLPFWSSLLSPSKEESQTSNFIKITIFSVQSPTILRTELNNKFVNIMEERCAQYSELDWNVAKMDGFSKILIVEVLDASMILYRFQIWLGITEKEKREKWWDIIDIKIF